MSTILLENHSSLQSSLSEPILRNRDSQLKGGLVPLRQCEDRNILVLCYALKGSTALFQSNYTGEKGIPRPFKKLLDIEPELTLIVEHMKCHNDPSIILSIIGSKNIWIYSWYFPSS